MQIKTIVFDLYNTLIKIEKPTHPFLKIYRNSKDKFGLTYQEYIQLVLTKETNELFAELPSDFKEEYFKILPNLELEFSSIIPFPETKGVLQKLASTYPLFLISNLASPYKKPFFELGLSQWFENPIFSCNFGITKPNPKIFEKIERLTNESGKQILMIGDSQKSDIEGAKSMNWNYLRIDRNNQKIDPKIIHSLSEIEQKLTT